MPIQAHSRTTYTGVIRGATADLEIWSWSLKFPLLGTTGDPDIPTLTAAAVQARSAYTARIAAHMPPWVVLTRVRHSIHKEGGLVWKTSEGQYSQGDAPANNPGTGNGGNRYPLQTALCVSLDTPRAGADGKGRLFLPWPSFGMTDDFVLTELAAQTMVNAVGGLIKDIRPTHGYATVMSSKGHGSQVTHVRVGRVPDTQRSRRSALTEAYVRSAVPE